VASDGPYLVTNARHLVSWLGQELPDRHGYVKAFERWMEAGKPR
jgi:hypothetical protein